MVHPEGDGREVDVGVGAGGVGPGPRDVDGNAARFEGAVAGEGFDGDS